MTRANTPAALRLTSVASGATDESALSIAIARLTFMRCRAIVAACAVAFAVIAPALPSAAQKLYKYRDADGVVVFTDRKPAAEQLSVEESQVQRRGEPPEVSLLQRGSAEGVTLVARNTYYAPVQIGYHLRNTSNVSASTPPDGLRTLAPRADTTVVLVRKDNPSAEMSFQSDFEFLPGDPQAVHRPDQPYRLPYALASSYRVSQAYPDNKTHTDAASKYAIDFVMPVGTGVFAARGGVVIEVASNFHEAGLDPTVDGPRANIVRVLHDDGTMALYVHLNWNAIRVVPGQRVTRGEYLADSGNTGFSTGPHLHFAVQRNDDGRMVSEPVEFADINGGVVTLKTGERYTAR